MVDFSDELKSQWHPSLNLPLTPETLTAVSKPVWWLGECGHSWQSSYLDKSRGYGCSYCAGKKILIGFNDLESQLPELAKEWHPTLNGDLLPSQVSSKSSSKKVWWQCKLGHKWDAKPLHRANGSGCPFCAGSKILAGFNDMATTNPQLASEWHPTKNLPVTPSEISASNPKTYWWICPDKGHEWQTQASDRNRRKTSCYYCSDFKVLVGYNDLNTTRPDLAQEWHPTKNGADTPSGVSANKSVKAWWLCNLGHEWESSVSNRNKGSGCPTCSGNRTLIGFNDLASRSPHLLSEWHPTRNLPKLPTDYSWSSGIKVWWLCSQGHEWEALISNRNNGAGCPPCGDKRGGILNSTPKAGINDLESQFPFIAQEWHPTRNLPLTPSMVRSGTGRRFWWLCKKGHEWETPVSQRTGKDKTNCPTCAPNIYVSKAEKEIHDFLVNLGLTVDPSNRTVLNGKEIDLYIPEKKFGIEYNGIYWHTENQGKDKTYHYDKWKTAQTKGITLLQIWEDDWRDRKTVIMKALAHKLNKFDVFATTHPEYASELAKIGARKTSVVILSTTEAGEFLDSHHIQGFASGSYYIGLNDATGLLRAVLVLKKEGLDELNIIRYATNGLIQGGFTKLLKYAADKFTPSSFISFADHCISDGGLYANNGFIVDKQIEPDYMYVVNGERKHKFGYRLKRFRDDPALIWQDGLTERELAALNGLDRIWDAGKTKYRYIL